MQKTKKLKQIAALALSLLAIALVALAQTPNKPAPKQPTLRDALVRDGDSKAKLTDAAKFEIVKQGTGSAVVRLKKEQTVLGEVKCGVCPGGKCEMQLLFQGVGCFGCRSEKDCTLNPF